MPTTSNRLRVFIDTCAFVAMYDDQDSTHQKTVKIATRLHRQHAQLYTSSDIVGETLTVISRKFDKPAAAAFTKQYLTANIDQIFITPEIHLAAQKLFFSIKSKNVSFIDCTSIAAMKQAKIPLAFTFDRHFQQAGLTLASTLLKKG